MFKNIKNNCVKRLTTHLEDLLMPYWNILREMYGDDLLLNIDFSDMDASFSDEVLKIKSISSTEHSKKDFLFSFAFSLLCKKYNKDILSASSLNEFSFKSTLLIISEPFILIQDTQSKQEESQNEIKRLFADKKVLTNLIDKGDRKAGLLDCIKSMDNSNFYNTLLGDDEDIDNLTIWSPVYPCSLLKLESLHEEIFSIDRIWINEKSLKENYKIEINLDENTSCYLLHKSKNDSGIDKANGVKINDLVFVLKTDIDEFIDKQKRFDYYWLLFKMNVFRNIAESKKIESPQKGLLKDFLDTTQMDDFSCLLSYLENNLYIKDQEIPDKYKRFFDPLVKFEKIDGLNNYDIFVHDVDVDSTLLGAYNTARGADDSSYNLKHLIEQKRPNLHCWTKSSSCIKKSKKIVNVLKPEIAYFFIEKFYEEFLFNILRTISCEYNNVEFVSNYNTESLPHNKHEIDFIVKSDEGLFFIEAKTKLTTSYINKYVKKCKQWYDAFNDIPSQIHFIIIGCYSDPELDVFRYSIKGEDIPSEYNKSREGLGCLPYYFKVPVMDTEKDLICITEPSFQVLTKTMKGILKV